MGNPLLNLSKASELGLSLGKSRWPLLMFSSRSSVEEVPNVVAHRYDSIRTLKHLSALLCSKHIFSAT